jgi:hypothetical protein
MPPRPAADATLTHTGSSADLHPALLPFFYPEGGYMAVGSFLFLKEKIKDIIIIIIMGPFPSPSYLAQTSTIYIYNDNLINDSSRNSTKKNKPKRVWNST